MGVALARGDNLTDDRQKGKWVISELNVKLKKILSGAPAGSRTQIFGSGDQCSIH